MSSSGVRSQTASALQSAHHELSRSRAVEVTLESPAQLLGGNGHARAGIDTLVGILDSSLRLPTTVTVRVSMPAGCDLSESQVSAFRAHCRIQAEVSWCEATTLRRGGVRALPKALLTSGVAAALGVVSGYLAQGTDHALLMVFFYAVGFMAVIAAWTIGWAPIEQAMFDWRAPAHTSAAYELLSTAHVEVVARTQIGG